MLTYRSHAVLLGQPERWGAVEELRRGQARYSKFTVASAHSSSHTNRAPCVWNDQKPLAPGALFPADGVGPLQAETDAWLELVSAAGTFSEVRSSKLTVAGSHSSFHTNRYRVFGRRASARTPSASTRGGTGTLSVSDDASALSQRSACTARTSSC